MATGNLILIHPGYQSALGIGEVDIQIMNNGCASKNRAALWQALLQNEPYIGSDQKILYHNYYVPISNWLDKNYVYSAYNMNDQYHYSLLHHQFMLKVYKMSYSCCPKLRQLIDGWLFVKYNMETNNGG